MAKTQEKRERIKWFFARRAFFFNSFSKGLALARHSEHEDAHFLVSLFPVAPTSPREAVAVFLAHERDPRCACWAFAVCGDLSRDLLVQSAVGGYAWGMVGAACESERQREWLEKAVVGGECEGMVALSHVMWRDETTRGRAKLLEREAAELGDPQGQFNYADRHCEDGSAEYFAWNRRCAMQSGFVAALAKQMLIRAAVTEMRKFAHGGSGRNVFELGMAFRDFKQWPETMSNTEQVDESMTHARILYLEWCREAEVAISCWIWAAKQLGLNNRDVRRLICEHVWHERAAWSERKRS